jgi:hypothetical protein
LGIAKCHRVTNKTCATTRNHPHGEKKGNWSTSTELFGAFVDEFVDPDKEDPINQQPKIQMVIWMNMKHAMMNQTELGRSQ